MSRFILLSFVLFMSACASSQDEKTPTAVETEPQQTTTVQTVKEPKPANKKRSNVNYITETARPSSQIKKEFPYDIDLKTAEGEIFNSEKIFQKNGKPTVLMFWLTTCVPCRYEMKAVNEKYAGWKEEADFNLYAISTDFQKNYEAFVKRVNESGWAWESYNDVNREFKRVMPGELNGLPQTFILDKDGKIVYHKRKYRPGDEDALFAKIKDLTGKG